MYNNFNFSSTLKTFNDIEKINPLSFSVSSSPSTKIVYYFNILKSRKKEKKYLRKKFNNVISRVHNMDCLLKKIKAYVFK